MTHRHPIIPTVAWIALACTALALTATARAQTPEPVILFVGQSNMVGTHGPADLAPIDVQAVLGPRVQAWVPFPGNVAPYNGTNSSGWLFHNFNRWGPELGVCAALALALPNFTIAKFARGRCSLMRSNQPPGGPLAFQDQIFNITAGLRTLEAALGTQGKVADYKALVFVQWEGDARSPAGYAAVLQQFIADVRAQTSPTLQIWIERPLVHPLSLSTGQAGQIAADMRAVAAQDPLVFVEDVNGPGITWRQDRVHRDRNGCLIEGARLGLAMIGLRGAL